MSFPYELQCPFCYEQLPHNARFCSQCQHEIEFIDINPQEIKDSNFSFAFCEGGPTVAIDQLSLCLSDDPVPYLVLWGYLSESIDPDTYVNKFVMLRVCNSLPLENSPVLFAGRMKCARVQEIGETVQLCAVCFLDIPKYDE